MNVHEAAVKWGITEHSVRKAVKENRVRHHGSESGEVSIPHDEIGPIPKASVQTILWIILRLKNDTSWKPDFSMVPDLTNDQLLPAFKQLVYRRYIDSSDEEALLATRFADCRLTEKGLGLIHREPLPGSSLGQQLLHGTATFAWQQLLTRIFKLLPI